MNKPEAVPAVKSLVNLSAALAGLDVSEGSLRRFVDLTSDAVDKQKVEDSRRPEAVGNLLRLIAATLDLAQERRHKMLEEQDADSAKERICPVYPFD